MRPLLILLFFLLATASAQAETAIEKINKTGSLTCGYVEYAPAIFKNPKTGVWGGFDVEIVKAIMDRLQLSAHYTTSTGWATVVPDLNAKKFDMLCTGFWVHPNVGRFALFSRPLFYQPVFIVARVQDTRFANNQGLNSPSLKMVALDGDNPLHIAKTDFPETQILALPNMTDFPQVLVNVANGKADFTIVDAATFNAYNDQNPGKLKIVSADAPIRIYPVSYAFAADNLALREAVNVTIEELLLDGTIPRILKKFYPRPNSYYRAQISYTQ